MKVNLDGGSGITSFDFQKVTVNNVCGLVSETLHIYGLKPLSTASIIIIMVVIYAEELVMFSYPLPPPQVRSFSNLEVCPNEIQRRK